MECAEAAGIHERVISSDHDGMNPGTVGLCASDYISVGDQWLYAPAPLHTDDCAMIDVVKDALARVPGAPDDIWVLLQPSSPLRTPEQVKQAIAMLTDPDEEDSCGINHWESVVSVVESEDPVEKRVVIDDCGDLHPYLNALDWTTFPTRRQDCARTYNLNGTVYAFRRRTVEQSATIYGYLTRPLIIEREDSLSIDTLDDWREAERRLKERETETPTPAFSGRGMLNLRG